jgi:hypothetical protein
MMSLLSIHGYCTFHFLSSAFIQQLKRLPNDASSLLRRRQDLNIREAKYIMTINPSRC